MSKIEELIREKSPNGVEYKRIDEISESIRGMSSVSNKWAEEGNCRFIDYMNAYKNLAIDVTKTPYATVKDASKQTSLKKGDILFTSASETIDECALSSVIEDEIEDSIFMDDHLFGIRLLEEYSNKFSVKFLKHYFRSKEFRLKVDTTVRGVTRFYVSKPDFMKQSIPMPPLEVQNEIAIILDKFGKLEAELEAELEARKNQYEFWRGNLYSKDYDKMVELDKIGDVTKLAGFEFTNYVTYSDEGTIIALRGLNVKNGKLILNDVKYIDSSEFSKLNRSKLYKNDILYTYVGTVGQVGLIDADDKYYLAPNVARIRITDESVIPKYVMYFLLTNEFKRTQLDGLSGTSSMKNITMSNIRKFKIPVPSIDEQKRIVEILDKFDKLINDISEGIPAEIKARRKQYEYYRDKLLSFEEVTV